MQKATTMVALVALLAAFALVLVASNNPAQAVPPLVTVNPQQDLPGQDTGIHIDAGDRVVIKASGLIDLDKNNPDPPRICTPDVPPDGKPNTANTINNLVLLSANHGALLGSIGPFSNTNGGFLVGSGTSFTAQKSGELYLIVNDTVGGFADNCGDFKAAIDVEHPDTTPPRVSSTVPAKGATGLGPNANAKATFSEDMRASTINGQTFELFKQGSTTKVGATVSYDASKDRAKLDPNSALQRGATYKAVVTTSATDEAGNRLDQRPGVAGLQQKQWSFTISD